MNRKKIKKYMEKEILYDRITNFKRGMFKKRKNCRRIKWKAVSKDNITRLNILQANDSSIISGSDKNKFFKDELIITVTSKGMLEIEDRRGSAFLWVFEIQHENGFRIYNAFELDKKIYTVQYLKESEATDSILDKIREVISDFDNSISILKSDISLDTWEYKYYDCHEEVTCNSLQEVFETVLKRAY